MKNNYPTDVESVFEAIQKRNTEDAKRTAIKPYMMIAGLVFVLIGFELMRQISWKVAIGAFFIWWAQNIFRKYK